MTAVALSHVADLIDKRYQREAVLHASHIHSFAPAIRFTEQFATNAEELAEYRAFIVANHKSAIWLDRIFEAAFSKKMEEARARRAASGKAWDGQLTAFQQRLVKLQTLEQAEYLQMQLPYRLQQADLFLAEVDRFSSIYASPEAWVSKTNTEFCKAVFASQQSDTGLLLDKKLSTKASPVYSKTVAQDWKVSIHIDGKHLNQSFPISTMNVAPGEVSFAWPRVTTYLALRQLGAPSRPTTFEFDWFFPIRELGSPSTYNSCRSHRELEAILRIHIEMFRLLERELVTALTRPSPS